LLSLLPLISEGLGLIRPQPWRLVFASGVLRQRADQATPPTGEWTLDEVFGDATLPEVLRELDRLWHGESLEARFVTALRCEAADCGAKLVELRLAPVRLGDERYIAMAVQFAAGPIAEPLPAARRDPLTGLADRTLLLSKLETLFGGERADDRRFALLFIDLDDFKLVNDGHGHVVGDRVLSEVARRLAGCVRAGDLIVRYGGDEFVVLVEHAGGWEEFEPVISRIHEAISQPIVVPTGELKLSVSVGAAEMGGEHRAPDDLLAAADRAMYAAKRRKSSPACAAG
jgi:diguanylate cyclase (GGDEF)-like protein